jgi:hypothetical protein
MIYQAVLFQLSAVLFFVYFLAKISTKSTTAINSEILSALSCFFILLLTSSLQNASIVAFDMKQHRKIKSNK